MKRANGRRKLQAVYIIETLGCELSIYVYAIDQITSPDSRVARPQIFPCGSSYFKRAATYHYLTVTSTDSAEQGSAHDDRRTGSVKSNRVSPGVTHIAYTCRWIGISNDRLMMPHSPSVVRRRRNQMKTDERCIAGCKRGVNRVG